MLDLEPLTSRDEALRAAMAHLGAGIQTTAGRMRHSGIVTAERVIPAQEAVYGEFPAAVNDPLCSVLEAHAA